MGSTHDRRGGNGHDGMSAEQAALFLTGGPAGRELRESSHEAGGPREGLTTSAPVLELHVCMGLNACKGHDESGQAKLPGTGTCATALHVCHGDNQCRGQGGCGYAGSEVEQTKPGEQSCSANGSCASPINECRVASAGPFKGTSVWKLARTRFEARMWDAGVAFDPAPGAGYPNDKVPAYETDRAQLFASLTATPIATETAKTVRTEEPAKAAKSGKTGGTRKAGGPPQAGGSGELPRYVGRT
ncbi:hypothetical protein FHX81_0047 [Saccharothrix saharensis]|uniref:Uncharacterized protein n=1 Tax=Saccharothrix saharensis TaxID=571190 RepID=A0A543J4Q3_9PSEU|nr:hypothetical protein [Saccharothrix saharensis]TQM77810.1 hypothetical protein FHX81_0047 [Saccharothrix saharensis]